MPTRYAHTNLIVRDWKRLAQFYIDVFGCTLVPPERHQTGAWLEAATGVANAALDGVHLRLPGHGENGPTLEIFSYHQMEDNLLHAANRVGLGHLAFGVDTVEETLEAVVRHGGSAVGKIVTRHIEGAGQITFVYAADPEGNLIELQQWS